MEADNSQLLSQLIDIHASGEPAAWPPAPGWWVLGVLLLIVLLWLARALARRMAVRRRKRRWLDALDSLSVQHDPLSRPHEYLAGLNRLFRAIALKAFPDTGCARFQGSEWVAFLSGLMPGDATVDSLEALASGPYEPVPEFDADALDRLARAWVAHYG